MPSRAPITVADLDDLASSGQAQANAAALGLQSAIMLAPAGSYTRRPPDFVEATEATPDTRAKVELYASILRQDHSAIYEFRLQDAIVVGQGAVVTRNGCLLGRTVLEFLVQGEVPHGFDSAGAPGSFHLAAPLTRRIEQPSLLLKRPWYRNYGHALVDGGGILGLLRELGRPVDCQLVIGDYVDPSMRDRVAEIIRVLAPGASVIAMPDDEAWVFSDLRHISPVQVPSMSKQPLSLTGIQNAVWELLDRSATAQPTPECIFVPRRHGVRRLHNHAEIAAVCASFGFAEAYPEDTDLAGQARLFRHARAVVGIKGAAMTNIVFCRQGTPVILLSPADFPDPFFMDIAGQMNLPYAEVFGRLTTRHPAGRNDFALDAGLLSSAIAYTAGAALP